MVKCTFVTHERLSVSESENESPSFLQTVGSVLMAFLGVQSNTNRERDFKRGKLSHFIWMGLLFGLLFVLTLVGVVQLVMHFTGNQA